MVRGHPKGCPDAPRDEKAVKEDTGDILWGGTDTLSDRLGTSHYPQ